MKVPMTSSRPYLIRAIYQWIIENGIEKRVGVLCLLGLRVLGIAIENVLIALGRESLERLIEIPGKLTPFAISSAVSVQRVILGEPIVVENDGLSSHQIDHLREVDVIKQENTPLGAAEAVDECLEVIVAFPLSRPLLEEIFEVVSIEVRQERGSRARARSIESTLWIESLSLEELFVNLPFETGE